MTNEDRRRVTTGSPFESIAGMSRAIRAGNLIAVTGTAPLGQDGKTIAVGDAAAQTRRCLEIIRNALEQLGSGLRDVYRTRIYLARIDDWEVVARAHGEFFSDIRAAARLGVPVTVHVAIGTDVHHMHPSADGAALGLTSYRDFETLTGLVSGLRGGVLFNVGSAVILPEVFLKALALARNLGHKVEGFTTVNLDFIRQYRPMLNVVERPTRSSGRGVSLIGHHEILVPLLAAALVEAVAGEPQ